MIIWMTIGYIVAVLHVYVHKSEIGKTFWGKIGTIIGLTIIAAIWPWTLLIIIRKL